MTYGIQVGKSTMISYVPLDSGLNPNWFHVCVGDEFIAPVPWEQ